MIKVKYIYYIFCTISDVGFTLRKDDPSGLKSIIQEIQSKASSQEAAALTDQSRVRFMLDVIMAVRNNNMRKIPNYDPEHLEHLKKLIRNYIRGWYHMKYTIFNLLSALEKYAKNSFTVYSRYLQFQGTEQNMSSYQ